MAEPATSVVKLLLEPAEEDRETLDGQSRICNWLYNTLLEKACGFREEFWQSQNPEVGLTLYSKRGLRNLLPGIKEEHSFLRVVHSSPLKNAALRLTEAIQAHQKSKKGRRKGRSGWPKFRSWQRSWFSLLYDEPGKGFKIEGSMLRLSLGMGQDRIRRSLFIPIVGVEAIKGMSVRNLRIVKQLGRFYAVFTVVRELPARKPIQKVVAIDPNHKNFGYGVSNDGRAFEIGRPLWLKNLDRRIDELKGRRGRCQRKSSQVQVFDEQGQPTGKSYWKSSKRWKKFDRALERAYQRRRDQTKTFLFTVSHRLCRSYDCVGVGDYTPDGSGSSHAMRRAMNNQSLIGRFKQVLAWVAAKSGKLFLEFDERGTTRTCHSCEFQHLQGLDPSIREWECPGCGLYHLRDENAAKNGLLGVLRELRTKYKVPCSGLAPVMERWAWRVLPSGVSTFRGQNGVPQCTAPGN